MSTFRSDNEDRKNQAVPARIVGRTYYPYILQRLFALKCLHVPGNMSWARIYPKLPRPLQVLVEDTQRLNEYGRFMRVFLTVGTIGFLYKFGQTMRYLESEKRPETPEEREKRRRHERELREKIAAEALASSRIVPPSDKHIRKVIERANS